LLLEAQTHISPKASIASAMLESLCFLKFSDS